MTDRCLDSHCEHPDHRDSKPPGAATDPLDTVPAEERRRIRNLAREERRAAPWAGKLVEEKAIAREVADYHERTGLRTVVADKAAQVSEDVIGQALTIASGAQAVESLTLDALRYEPARTDPLFARVIAEATQHDARLVPPAPDLSDLAAGKARGLVRSGASSADLLDRLTSEAIPRLAVEATAADPDRSRLRAAVSDAAGIVLAIATLRGGQ